MSKTKTAKGVVIVHGIKNRRGGKKNRKHNRNKKKCEAYRLSGRREENKERREARRLQKLAKRSLKKGISPIVEK